MLDYFDKKAEALYILCLAQQQLSSHIALHGCDLSSIYTPLLFLLTIQHDEAQRRVISFDFVNAESKL